MADRKLSLTQRKEIKDNEAKLNAHIAKINTDTGVTFTLEPIDFLTLADEIDKNYKERLAEAIEMYLKGLAINIEALVKDEMSKEAFLEALTAKKIQFVFHPAPAFEKAFPKDSAYNPVAKFEGGVLQIHLASKNVPTTRAELTGKDIEKLL